MRGISSSALKIIAIVTMVIDHVGYILFPQHEILRIIGRIAFPIFAFLCVEGFFHTRSINRYMGYLFAFAIISEVPFNLFSRSEYFYPGGQNVLFTLLLGVIMMRIITWLRAKENMKHLEIPVMLLFCALAALLHSDYTFIGIGLIYVFYITRGDKIKCASGFIIYTCLLIAAQSILPYSFINIMQAYMLIALIPIFLYSGEKGARLPKNLMYLVYPAHMLILQLIWQYLW